MRRGNRHTAREPLIGVDRGEGRAAGVGLKAVALQKPPRPISALVRLRRFAGTFVSWYTCRLKAGQAIESVLHTAGRGKPQHLGG